MAIKIMRDFQKDFKNLLKHKVILRDCFQQNYERRFEYPQNDHFSFMVLCFLSKQYEHSQSVLSLIEAKYYSDAMIIARNMLEGLGIINWVSKDLQKRALQWRNYSAITDYRNALKKTKGIRENIDKEVLERLNQIGVDYLCERYKKPKVQKSNLPIDPYKHFWNFDENGSEVSVYKMLSDADINLYAVYNDMSDWVHWNVNRIGLRIKRDKSEVGYIDNPIGDACLALSSSFLSLIYLMEVLDEHLELNIDSLLDEISNNYKSDLIKNAI